MLLCLLQPVANTTSSFTYLHSALFCCLRFLTFLFLAHFKIHFGVKDSCLLWPVAKHLSMFLLHYEWWVKKKTTTLFSFIEVATTLALQLKMELCRFWYKQFKDALMWRNQIFLDLISRNVDCISYPQVKKHLTPSPPQKKGMNDLELVEGEVQTGGSRGALQPSVPCVETRTISMFATYSHSSEEVFFCLFFSGLYIVTFTSLYS